MTTEADALKAAEAALEAAKAAVVAVEHSVASETSLGSLPPSAPAQVEPDVAGAESVYLGHVGEHAVKGKDFG